MSTAIAPHIKHEIIAEAIERMPLGASLVQLAAEAGIQTETLRAWLLGTVPDQYRHLQERGLIARIIDCDGELDNADSMLAVNKADRKAKYARWDAERRLKHLFAHSTELTGAGGAPLVAAVDPQELARRVAFLLEKGKRSGVPAEIVVEPDDFSDLA